MTLPTPEEIRRKALELWYKRYAPKTGSYTTPTEQELKELGLWQEAQLELMRSEASRLENMIEEATAQDIEQLYQAIEELMNRLDELEQEIKKIREKQEERKKWETPLLGLEQQVVELEAEDKITPEEAQQLYTMIRRARELDGRNREAYNMLVRDIRSLIERYRERAIERRTTPKPRIELYRPPQPTHIPVTYTPITPQPQEKRVYLRLKGNKVCFDEETELEIEDTTPVNMIDYIRNCEYIYGSPTYFTLDKYIELTPRAFRPITYWRWIADIIKYIRNHQHWLRSQLMRGERIYFRFPETEPRIEGYT